MEFCMIGKNLHYALGSDRFLGSNEEGKWAHISSDGNAHLLRNVKFDRVPYSCVFKTFLRLPAADLPSTERSSPACIFHDSSFSIVFSPLVVSVMLSLARAAVAINSPYCGKISIS